MFNTTIVDWSSAIHLVYGIALAYSFRKKIVWVIIFIIGYEILELTILPIICCANFWLETPANIFGDIIIGSAGYFVGKIIIAYSAKLRFQPSRGF